MSEPQHLSMVADEVTQMHMGSYWPAKEWVVQARVSGVGFDETVTLADDRIHGYVMRVHLPEYIIREIARRWLSGPPPIAQRWKLRRAAGADALVVAEPWER